MPTWAASVSLFAPSITYTPSSDKPVGAGSVSGASFALAVRRSQDSQPPQPRFSQPPVCGGGVAFECFFNRGHFAYTAHHALLSTPSRVRGANRKDAMNYRIPVVKLSMIRDGSITTDRRTLSDSHSAAALCRSIIGDNDREEMLAVILDAKHKINAVHSISVGTLSLSLVHPREVFKAAVLCNAAAMIIAHNHPSGDPTPSQEDRLLTKRLRECGELMGISILDHLVIGDAERYYSFADNGVL